MNSTDAISLPSRLDWRRKGGDAGVRFPMNSPRLLAAALALCCATSQATELSLEQWENTFVPAVTKLLCRDESYFRQCFATSPERCEKEAIVATRICLLDLSPKLPKTFTSIEQAMQVGAAVGRCAGTTMELSLLRSKISGPKCNDPSAWK